MRDGDSQELERGRSAGRLMRRPSPGTVISTIALFVALGGTAAALKGTNTVNNGDVKDLKFKPLNLTNGWVADPERAPKVAIDAQGVVHLVGGIQQPSGSDQNAFLLPAKYRPTHRDGLDIPVDLSTGFTGRIGVGPNGIGSVDALSGQHSAAQAFTSLEGVTFPTE